MALRWQSACKRRYELRHVASSTWVSVCGPPVGRPVAHPEADDIDQVDRYVWTMAHVPVGATGRRSPTWTDVVLAAGVLVVDLGGALITAHRDGEPKLSALGVVYLWRRPCR